MHRVLLTKKSFRIVLKCLLKLTSKGTTERHSCANEGYRVTVEPLPRGSLLANGDAR